MASALRKTVEVTGLPVPDVSAMACATPAAFLSLEDRIDSIASGPRADWVWLDAGVAVSPSWLCRGLVSDSARGVDRRDGVTRKRGSELEDSGGRRIHKYNKTTMNH